MRPSIRTVLADSHVAAVAVAVFLLWSIDGAFRALWQPLVRVLRFLVTAVAILDIPYIAPGLTLDRRSALLFMSSYLYGAILSLAAAWVISRWVYGVGPLPLLSRYRSRLTRGKNA